MLASIETPTVCASGSVGSEAAMASQLEAPRGLGQETVQVGQG